MLKFKYIVSSLSLKTNHESPPNPLLSTLRIRVNMTVYFVKCFPETNCMQLSKFNIFVFLLKIYNRDSTRRRHGV